MSQEEEQTTKLNELKSLLLENQKKELDLKDQISKIQKELEGLKISETPVEEKKEKKEKV
jgi:hypothetical protein